MLDFASIAQKCGALRLQNAAKLNEFKARNQGPDFYQVLLFFLTNLSFDSK